MLVFIAMEYLKYQKTFANRQLISLMAIWVLEPLTWAAICMWATRTISEVSEAFLSGKGTEQ